MKRNSQMPKYHELMNPLLKALHELGGSGSIEEIAQKVSELSGLPEDVLNIPHNPEKSSQTEIEYRLAWARTYLKKYGLLENSDRGIWLIVPEKRDVKSIPDGEVLKGEMPNKKLKLIQAWVEIHQEELMANWKLAVEGQQPYKIEPLR